MKPWVSFDVETDGDPNEFALQPWRVRQEQAFISTCAWTRRDEDKLLKTHGVILQQGSEIDFKTTRDYLAELLESFIRMDARVVGWNMPFDLGWLIAYGLEELVFKLKWLDAMRLWRHLDSIPTFQGKQIRSLYEANKKFEPSYADYKEEGKDLYFNRAPAMRKKLLRYNRQDTEATLLHTERFWNQLTPEQQRCALIESSCLPYVARANVTGMKVDKDAREKLANTLAEVGHEMARFMAPHGVTEVIVRSPARTATLLYKTWQLPVIKNTTNAKGEDTDKPSTDKEVLHELAVDDDRVLNLGRWREALNLRNKFMVSLLKSIEYNEEDDVTYPQATVYATYTGRMTYSSKQGKGKAEKPIGFALHQMKRDPRFRNCIIAPEGCAIVEFDASGQEFRWMAIKSGDETMLSLCLPGGDAHTFMAGQIYGEDYEWLKTERKAKAPHVKKKRELGKVANLSLQYRTSKKKLRIVARVQNNLPMTPQEAAHIWSTYRNSYVGVPDYWRAQIQLGKQYGYAETLAGRRVRVEGDWTGDHSWAMESTMINHPIQGTGGDQKYLAIHCLHDTMLEYDARFAWDLHDGIYFYVPIDKAMAFAEAGKKVLDNLPYNRAWGLKSPIPLPWDAKCGPAWGSLEEQEF